MSQGLLRQRRNLLLISILLPLFYFNDASIEQINFFGTVIILEKQHFIYWTMFIFFGYFFLRYFQYYKEERHTHEIGNAFKKSMYSMEAHFFNKVAHERKKLFGWEDISITLTSEVAEKFYGYSTTYSTPDDYVSIFNKKTYAIAHLIQKSGVLNEEDKLNSMDRVLKENAEAISKHWKAVKPSSPVSPEFRTDIEYSVFRAMIYRVIGIYMFIINQSYFTDYQLPFLVSLISISSVITDFVLKIYC